MEGLRKPGTVMNTENAIINNTRKALDFVNQTSKTGMPVTFDEMNLCKLNNSDIITLTLTNLNAANSVIIPFGTPLGTDEAALLPNFNATIPVANQLATFIAANELNDGTDTDAPTLRLFLTRLLRNPLLVHAMEIVTDNSTLGQNQRKQVATDIIVPYQSADARKLVSPATPIYTEFTGSQILESAKCWSDFTGSLYTILPLASVSINLYVTASKVAFDIVK